MPATLNICRLAHVLAIEFIQQQAPMRWPLGLHPSHHPCLRSAFSSWVILKEVSSNGGAGQVSAREGSKVRLRLSILRSSSSLSSSHVLVSPCAFLLVLDIEVGWSLDALVVSVAVPKIHRILLQFRVRNMYTPHTLISIPQLAIIGSSSHSDQTFRCLIDSTPGGLPASTASLQSSLFST